MFEHDYEINTLGPYLHEEIAIDWIDVPSWVFNQLNAPLNIIKDASDLINPSKVMEWNYPQGTISPWNGGGQIWSYLTQGYDEVYLSMNFKFGDEFHWGLGGKMFGLTSRAYVVGETVGDHGGSSFNIMWKEEGRLVAYSKNHDAIDASETMAFFGPDHIQSNKWYTLTVRIVNNTLLAEGSGRHDGIIEVFLNGKKVFEATDKKFRNFSDVKWDIIRNNSWFGGATDEWAARRDEVLYVDNFVLFQYGATANVVRDNTPWPKDATIPLPNLLFSPDSQIQTPVTLNDARGEACGGRYPIVDVMVNYQWVGQIEPGETASDYVFYGNISVSDVHTIYVRLSNHLYESGVCWRTLHLPSITFDGSVYLTEGPGVLWDQSHLDYGTTSTPGRADYNDNGYNVFSVGQ